MASDYQPLSTNDYPGGDYKQGRDYKQGSTGYSVYIGHAFLILSLILSIIFLISAYKKGNIKNGITIVTIISWIIFGILFSIMFYKNNNTIFNVSTSIFVIFISCVVTFRQI
jgi:hypothetical protein